MSAQQVLSVLALLALAAPAVAQGGTAANQASVADAAVLQVFKGAMTNWDSATAGQNFVGWSSASVSPCTWTGVQCNSGGRVTSLQLQGLALQGTLPRQLTQLAALTTLNLGSNAIGGPLPVSWGSGGSWQSLAQLNLEKNLLNGTLPAAWGAAGAFPALQLLGLSSNSLTGHLPPEWGSTSAFPALTTITVADNGLSGQLPGSWGVDGAFAKLKSLQINDNRFSGTLPSAWGRNGSFVALADLAASNNTLSGALPAAWGSSDRFPALQTLELQYNQISGEFPSTWSASTALTALKTLSLKPGNDQICGALPTGGFAVQYSAASGVTYPITSSLGTCTQTCGKLVTSRNETNLYDISVEAGAALGDLLALNPTIQTAASIPPGSQLARPCYPNNPPTYFGADLAMGKPTAQSTTAGNGTASLAVSGTKGCSQTQDGTAAQPAWWKVDLGVSTEIEGLIITSAIPMSDLQIAIGDQDSATANTPCSQGQQIAANSPVAQVCQGKGRFVVLTRASGNGVSLCLVEVFPTAADATQGKTVTSSAGTNLSDATDGSTDSCASLTPAAGAAAALGPWFTADLGYTADLAAVGLTLGAADLTVLDLRAGVKVVKNGNENPLCTQAVSDLPGYSRVLYRCPAKARYITVAAPSSKALDICMLSTFLQDPPSAAALSSGDPFSVAPGPVTAPVLAAAPLAPAPEPGPMLPPLAAVGTEIRLALIGPYVVPFDGKETAVTNTVLQVLEPYTNNVTVLSYTVGAPVSDPPAAAPAASAGRRLFTIHNTRPRQLLVSKGSVLVYMLIVTTERDQQAATRLLQESVNSGNFTQVLNDNGLPTQTVRVSVVPQNAPNAPVPVPEVPGLTPTGELSPTGEPGVVVPTSGSGKSASAGAIAGGVVGGLLGLLLLCIAAWVFLLRRKRQREQHARPIAAVPPPQGQVRGKEFIDPESGSDSGSASGASGGDGGKSGAAGCFSWGKGKAGHNRPRQGDSPGEYHQSTAFKTSLDAPNGGAKGGSRDAFAVAANGSPDATLMTAPSDTPLLDRTFPGPLLHGDPFRRSDSAGAFSSPRGGSDSPLSGPDFLAGDSILELSNLGPLPTLPLMRGISDATTESEGGPLPTAADTEVPTARWSATSAGLWPITYTDLRFQKQIGEGSFGRVYLAKWRETTVAVKLLHRQLADHEDDDLPAIRCSRDDPILAALQREAGIMASVRHPNVISYLGICTEPACIVTEYCSKGSLTDVLRRGRSSSAHALHLDWPKRLNMAMDAAKGMLHLHLCEPPIIHRDLKSPNLLVDKHWRVKVCDFNLSRVMEESVVLSSMVASNPRWLAPEILGGLPYTVAADVYSFGIIMWELLTWEVPWHEQNTWQVHAMVTVEKLRPDVPADLESLPGGAFAGLPEYVALMQACWAQDPDQRPDFETVIGRLRRLLAVEALTNRAGSGNLREHGTSASSNDVRSAAIMAAQANVINSSPAIIFDRTTAT